MNWYAALALASLSVVAGCSKEGPDDSSYVLIRSTVDGLAPGLRAYFLDGSASLRGTDCRELLQYANEAIDARLAQGERLQKYECVSLSEARERGFK